MHLQTLITSQTTSPYQLLPVIPKTVEDTPRKMDSIPNHISKTGHTSLSSRNTCSRFSVVFIAFLWWALCLFSARLSKATTLSYCSALVAVERKGRGRADNGGGVECNWVSGTLGPCHPVGPLALLLLPVDCEDNCSWDSGPVGIGGMWDGVVCVLSSLISAANMAPLKSCNTYMLCQLSSFRFMLHVYITYTVM